MLIFITLLSYPCLPYRVLALANYETQSMKKGEYIVT